MKANHYLHRIEKEALQAMPLAAFDGEVVVVDKAEMVADAVRWLRTQRIVGVDTEA